MTIPSLKQATLMSDYSPTPTTPPPPPTHTHIRPHATLMSVYSLNYNNRRMIFVINFS